MSDARAASDLGGDVLDSSRVDEALVFVLERIRGSDHHITVAEANVAMAIEPRLVSLHLLLPVDVLGTDDDALATFLLGLVACVPHCNVPHRRVLWRNREGADFERTRARRGLEQQLPILDPGRLQRLRGIDVHEQISKRVSHHGQR